MHKGNLPGDGLGTTHPPGKKFHSNNEQRDLVGNFKHSTMRADLPTALWRPPVRALTVSCAAVVLRSKTRTSKGSTNGVKRDEVAELQRTPGPHAPRTRPG